MKLKLATKVVEKVGPKIGKIALKAQKHSPEILLGVGIVGIGACVVLACKSTMKLEEVIDEHKNAVEKVKKCPEGTPKKQFDRDIAKVYGKTGVKLVKLYLPSACVGALSVACICGAQGILLKRVAGLTAAYTAVDEAFKDYRGRVVAKYGEDVDRELRYGAKEELVVSAEVDENGESKLEHHITIDNTKYSQYAFFFDPSCSAWEEDPEYNKMYIMAQQEYLNAKLSSTGHLFLNEVYDAFGAQRTSAGAVVGWIKGNGDGYVDLGLFRGETEADRRFINGLENVFLLDPNVDGVIFDKI
jgi:hypothetical protein